tara:strand:- start:593 stop:796 length:204 start_codon:yes stop_codon:yes gene_type:complete
MAFINYYNKDIAIYDNNEFITDCTMRDFILDNDGLTKDEVRQLANLKLNESCLISTNCDYAKIVRIK